jgi:cytochrome c oxidase subunit 3
MVSVGTIVWLSSELMFFAGLFAMYFTARAQAAGDWPPHPTHLNLFEAVPVTLVLIASSFTCQMGVFAAERGDVYGLRRWYTITLIMGAIFVAGQGYEYHALVNEGTTIPSSAYGSVFYLATGFHGMHVIGGLVAFVFLLMRTRMSKFTPAQATAAIEPGGMRRACRSMTSASSVTSAEVGRFIFIATAKPAIWAGVADPVMI